MEEDINKSSTIAIASGTVVYPGNVDQNGQKPSKTSNVNAQFPGVRKQNPLSVLSSYTYSISLYMVSPEIMNNFILSGGKMNNINRKGKGIYLVAQSGGINNKTDRRLPNNTDQLFNENGGVGLDYFIDDLDINTLMPGGASRATVSTTIKFKIIEPTSFTFLQDIAKASADMFANSAILSKTQVNDVSAQPLKQHYILGIKFYGYDVNGNLVKSNDTNFTGYDNGYSDQNSIIERYFPIKLTHSKFKLDGKTVVYNCEAVVVSEQAAYGQINATIKNPMTLIGSTVGDVLNGGSDESTQSKNVKGLTKILSDEAASYLDKQITEIPTKYSIEFLNSNGGLDPNSPIATAKLIDDATFVNTVAPMSPAQSTDKVTIAESFKNVSYDPTKKVISLTKGQNILTAIDNIIVKSNYVTNALTEVTSQDAETDSVKKSPSSTLKWYSVNPVVKVNGFDSKTKNWSYDITYQIKPYDVAYIRSVYTGTVSRYPGPYKEYKYWLTGENTEILSYEQQYDNLYYTILSTAASGTGTNTEGSGSASVGPQNSGGSDPTTGGQNRGSQINENVRAQLYSPGDQSQAKIKIIGDPDYIVTSTGVNGQTFSKFYGSAGSINPFSGQVFIQISFNTASDYLNNGLLDVSNQLQFYGSTAAKKAGIEGIVYMVAQVDSTFSKGSFTQVLDCIMVDENRLMLGNKGSSSNNGQTNNQNQRSESQNTRVPTGTLISNENQSESETNRLLSRNTSIASDARVENSPTRPTGTPAPVTRTNTSVDNSNIIDNTTVATQTGQVVDDDAVTGRAAMNRIDRAADILADAGSREEFNGVLTRENTLFNGRVS